MHRCQGTGQLGADPGPAEGPLQARRRRAGRDGSRGRHPGRRRHDARRPARASRPAARRSGGARRRSTRRLAAARAAFDPASPASRRAGARLGALRPFARPGPSSARSWPTLAPRAEIDGRLQDEEADVEAALALAQGLVLEARADDGLVTPGQRWVSRWRSSTTRARPLELEALELEAPPGWTRRAARGGEPGAARRRPRRAAPASRSRRRRTRGPRSPTGARLPDRDRHELVVAADETLPWSPPPVVALRPAARGRRADRACACRSSGATRAPSSAARGGTSSRSCRSSRCGSRPRSRRFRSPAPRKAAGGPGLGAQLLEERRPRRGAARGAARLHGRAAQRPPRRSRSRARRRSRASGSRRRPSFAPGTLALRAVATRDGREHRDTVQAVEYDHVERRQLLRPAETRLLVLDVRTTPGRLGGLRDGIGRRARRRDPAAGRAADAARARTICCSPTSGASRRSSSASAPTRRAQTCAPPTGG